MPHALLKQQVKDPTGWKAVFDQDREKRARLGCVSEQIFCLANDPHQLFIVLGWNDESRLRQFIESDELQQSMQRAGVTGSPEIAYLKSLQEPLENFARTLLDAFNSRTPDKSDGILSHQIEWTDAATSFSFKGRDGFRQFQERWLTAFPDGTAEIINCFSSSDQIVVEYVGRGTHTGPLLGKHGTLPPTGKRVELKLCDVMQVRDGKVIRGRTYYDSASLLSQLGQTPLRRAA
jgi:steroid delta-isomerase-like uncharacterized protein